MKKLLLLLFIVSVYAYGQTKTQNQVVAEGIRLYKTEMASWYGTDLFFAKLSTKRDMSGGYFSYVDGNKNICVFFSRESTPKIIATITFDSTYNIDAAEVDGTDRAPTKRELDLLEIRQLAFLEMKTDTLFQFYDRMNPNLIPLSDEKGKRVYILTGPKDHGVVVFGNDYLLTFNKKGRLKEKKRLHKNIIAIKYDEKDMKVSTMHTHLPQTGDLITATDICTLMLYEKFAGWNTHYVVSKDNVSIWDCKKNRLFVMTTEAWKRIGEEQEK